ncbi:MAG: hypothetical protein GY721_03880, partial [Deltaproteobacteria bacterium]|nr:hypothetical protein [Deltaproteobacteria bacterium]
MSDNSENGNDEILTIFVEESKEHLDVIEPALLSLEEDGSATDPESINAVFRAVHSIKGSAGFFGLKKVTELAHIMENLMAKVRENTIAPTPEVVDPLLKGVDKLQLMIGDISASEEVDVSQEVSVLEAVMSGEQGKKKDVSIDTPAPEEVVTTDQWEAAQYEEARRIAIANGHILYSIELPLPSEADKRETTVAEVNQLLASIGSIIESKPDIREETTVKELSGSGSDIVVSLLFSTVIEKGILLDALKLPDENITPLPLTDDAREETGNNETVAEEVAAVTDETPVQQECVEAPAADTGPADAPKAVARKASSKSSSSSESVRVKVDLLDKIMALAGELVLGRNQLLRQYSDKKNNTILVAHSQRVTELQESVMKTRLQPVGAVFSKFKRIVRDMAKKVEKEINLTLEGEDVELDRSIIEVLSDPLTHMIRNSADHALEPPAERKQCGKPAAGNIFLRAFHEGGQVIIEIEDDGRGIDAEKIKNKAIQKGILSEDDSKKMSEQELVNLIFHAGFSTVSEVSQLSGRGVGMDVVKRSFEKLGSTIDLRTTVGKGTLFTVRLPLTLAILPSLVVTVNAHTFAIPQVDITEIVRIKEGEIAQSVEFIEGQAVYRLRGKLLPVIKLADILDIVDQPSGGENEEGCKGKCREDEVTQEEALETESGSDTIQRLIVLRYGTNHLGLLVDAVLDPEEIVVKPMPQLVKQCKTFSGATIMGDGHVAMILNIGGIIEKVNFRFDSIEKRAHEYQEEERKKAMQEKQSLLIFKNPSDEYFGLSLSMISRIEKIRADQITLLAGKRFVQLRGTSIQLICVEDYIKDHKSSNLDSDIYVIIPKVEESKVGIVAREIVDVIETALSIDTDSIESPTVLGSAIINDNMTLIVDVYTLLETALPGNNRSSKCVTSQDGADGGRVLLVEDTPFFRNLEERYLVSSGFTVTTASDGSEGLEILQKSPDDFDIVVS